jgi:hypothetical protein
MVLNLLGNFPVGAVIKCSLVLLLCAFSGALAACHLGAGYLSPTDGATVPGGIMLGQFKAEASADSKHVFQHCIVRERDLESNILEACGEPIATYRLPGESEGLCYAYKTVIRGAYPVGQERNYGLVCTTTGTVIGKRHNYSDASSKRRVLYVFFVASLPHHRD